MNENLKTTLIAACVALLVVVGARLVGEHSTNPDASFTEKLGAAVGITRYPNSGVVARYFRISTTTPQVAGTDGQLTVGPLARGITQIVATTTTWDPGILSAGAATSTEVSVSSTVTGFKRGFCSLGEFSTASSSGAGAQIVTGCYYATSTAVLSLFVPASSSQAYDFGVAGLTIYQIQF